MPKQEVQYNLEKLLSIIKEIEDKTDSFSISLSDSYHCGWIDACEEFKNAINKIPKRSKDEATSKIQP